MRLGSRYQVLTITAVAALAVSGCSGSSGDGKQVTFASYGSAYQDAQNEALLDPWSAETDTAVTNDSPTSYPKIAQMVDANQVMWDVVDTEPFYPVANCGKYVEKLDLSKIDVSKFPPGTVSDCAIPFAQYSTVMVYDTKKFEQGPTSYADFFDLQRFPGIRMVPNWAGGGALELALLADGVAPENLYPLDLDRAFAKLDTIRDSLRFWNTSSESQQAMEDGTADIAFMWSGRAYEAEKNGATLTPVWDNNLLAWASLSIIKGTKNLEAAQSLIEYAATPEPQARFAELQPYSPANSDAAPKLDELQQKYDVAAPEIQGQAVITNVQYWADNNDAANKAWTAWSTS
ncbi:ABC transporter substrate-binding protein [Mycolicibacterium sp. 624]|uniref:ABC transporter substrate-binding protein n=1 Tax=Mycolicibacterium sp. 624 TaxID=3156314 RepID=UPI003392D1CD